MLSTLLTNAPMLAATLRVVAPLWVAPPSYSIVPAPPPVAAIVRDALAPVTWMPLPTVMVVIPAPAATMA